MLWSIFVSRVYTKHLDKYACVYENEPEQYARKKTVWSSIKLNTFESAF